MGNDERCRAETGASAPDSDREPESPGRRRALKYGAIAALFGVAGVGAGLRYLDASGADGGPSATEVGTEAATATATGAEGLPELVRRFAPDLYFGRRERWFPTDPRPYASESDGRRVVDGFDALAGYSREFRSSSTPPRPTVFYRVVPLDGSIVALQYWMYSVFDQFAVNFHWHDWELLQVFVDRDAGEAILLSASAHARRCPNNEFLRPDLGPGERPVVLSEVGSHSSATDVNGNRSSFERLPDGTLASDVSNGFLRPLDGLVEQPFAYGLPRDEGARLPYSMPELDGVPLHRHPDLVGVERDDFLERDVTVRSWDDLARPPDRIPGREPGLVLTETGSRTDGDGTYDLIPLAEASRRVDDFTGPRLSFEFAIPGFVEERFADHITSAGIPWEDPRSTDPAGDVTDPAHRRAIDGEAPQGLNDRVVGAVSMLSGRPDGDIAGAGTDEDGREDLDPFVPVSLFPVPVEVACLLRSDPVATATSGGVFRFLHVDAGPHELVINGPGVAPYAERFGHDGGTVRPGVDGRVALVANEDAAVLRADRRDASGIERVRVVESFVGPVFDARPVEDDRFAIPVHRDGRYTVEISDREGVRGAVRVDPRQLDGEPIPRIETGKAALARNLVEFLAATADLASELGDSRADQDDRSVPLEFEAAARDAVEAADVASEGDAAATNELLVDVVDRLLRARGLLADGSDLGYGEAAAGVLRSRAGVGIDRAEVAYGTPVVG